MLYLRQDNADLRLTDIGREVGLVNDERYNKFSEKKKQIEKVYELLQTKYKCDEKMVAFFEKHNESVPTTSMTPYKMIKRTNINIFDVKDEYDIFTEFDNRVLSYVNTEVKFEGYIAQEKQDIEKFNSQENLIIPDDFDYENMKGIRIEAKQKLAKIRPRSIGQASRISGVSPADVTILIMQIKHREK